MGDNLQSTALATLAYYSIRSKQSYIYRTNRIKEIAGASEAITNAFNYFLFNKKINNQISDVDKFVLSKAIDEFNNPLGQDGFVLFKGGGNLLVLFRNKETCLKHNKIFSKVLLEKYYSMTPLCCAVEVDLSKDNYSEDYKKLMKQSIKVKQTEMPCEPVNALPFVMMDRNTFQPVKCRRLLSGKVTEVSSETDGKLECYLSIKNKSGITQLDDLITKKGEESLLAVVYIDGNNMGAKIGRLLEGKTKYDECINALRSNSDKIDAHYICSGEEAVKAKLAEIYGSSDNKHLWRRIVGGGDEITFICNARYALQLAQAYLDKITDKDNSSCAGIAVFHSHFPFSVAYKIAEEACENAKEKTRCLRNKAGFENIEVSAIDFQFIHCGIDSDLGSIREEQNGDKMGRPYIYKAMLGEMDVTERAAKDGVLLLSKLFSLEAAFSRARSSVKEMGTSVSKSDTAAKLSFKRIVSQYKGMENTIAKVTKDETELFRLFYDLVEFYDLWFDNRKSATAEKGETSK